tara:strand:+ start:794 stop:1621 length:828 start_codon:yes stop_codon:yes gene_type:complete
MNPELEKLLDFALADGVITDKEREIIRKKAEKLGEDPDEAEMILDAKLAMQNKDAEASVPPPSPTPPPVAAVPPTSPPPPSMPPPTAKQKSSKVGNIMTCPACGSSVNAMELNCSECGHEFRNVNTSDSLDHLKSEIKKIHKNAMEADPEGGKIGKWFAKAFGDDMEEKLCNSLKNQANFIRNHNFGNSKEEILDHLTHASSQIISFNNEIRDIQKKADDDDGWMSTDDEDLLQANQKVKNAWITLVEQCKSKATLGIKDEGELKRIINIADKIK